MVADVDAHTDEHHVAVLDRQGRLLGTAPFVTTADGYRQLIEWLQGHGPVDRIGVESTGAYAAALVRQLIAAGFSVVGGVVRRCRTARGGEDPYEVAGEALRGWEWLRAPPVLAS